MNQSSQMQDKSWLQLQRFQEYEMKKKKQLEQQFEKSFKVDHQNTRSKSINWIGDIHERQTLIQKAKWKWIEEQKKLLEEKKEIQQLEGATFHPTILNKQKKLRTPNQFYDDNLNYKTKTEQSIQRLKKELDDRELKKSHSPIINKKSAQLIVQPFFDRLKEKQIEKEQNLLKIKQNTTPSFSPQIYSRSFQSRQIYHQVQQIQNISYASQKQQDFNIENITANQHSFEIFENIRRKQDPSCQEEKIKKHLILLTENTTLLNIPSLSNSPQCTAKKHPRSISPYKSIVSKKTAQKNYFKK